MPGHQHLTFEQTEHIRYGYYETHGQHISDHHLANLSKDQLRYYHAQANYYATLGELEEVQSKRSNLIVWVVVLALFIVLILVGAVGGTYWYLRHNDTVTAQDHSLDEPNAQQSTAGLAD